MKSRKAVPVQRRFSGKSPLLPGEATARSDLVDAAVRAVNAIYVSKGLEAAREIGGYVLETFFAGSAENFRRRGRKHASFRMLAGREDLRVSPSFVWTCVAVVDQLKQLPEDLANALPVTHHRLLLPVHDARAKTALACRAVHESLSTRALADEVRRLRVRSANTPQRGRPPLPPIVRLLTSLGRIAANITSDGGKQHLSLQPPGR